MIHPPKTLHSFSKGLFPLLFGLTLACGDPESIGSQNDSGLLVFAAASTTEVISSIAEIYEARTGVRIRCNFAASSTLVRQVEAGAPADLILSADPQWMDRLEEKNLIQPGSRIDLFENSLVLIAPTNRGFEISMNRESDLAQAFEGRLAMGDPAHVPAGRYARQAMETLGWWDAMQNRLLPALDVKDALRLVALGEAPAGIVYSTDAAGNDHVEVLGAFPLESHDTIRYPAAVCGEASTKTDSFLEFLTGAEARALYQSAGFTPLPIPTHD